MFEHLAPILSLISPTTTNYKDRLKKPKPKYVGPAFASIAWTLKQTKKRHTHQVQLVQDPDYQAEAILVNPPAHRLAVRLYEVNQVL